MGPSSGNWLAAHRADLTLGKTAFVYLEQGHICLKYQSPELAQCWTIFIYLHFRSNLLMNL